MMDYFVGQIELFPYNYIPANWVECNGNLLSINEYNALFALLGTKYGGDGRTNFALPNLKDANPIPNMTYCIALNGLWPMQP